MVPLNTCYKKSHTSDCDSEHSGKSIRCPSEEHLVSWLSGLHKIDISYGAFIHVQVVTVYTDLKAALQSECDLCCLDTSVPP